MWGGRFGFWAVSEPARREQFPGLGEQVAQAGTEQTVVTDFDEAVGEHVLKEAAHELLGTHLRT